MYFKANINHIHFSLSEKFETVQIQESESKEFGKFFRVLVDETLPVIIPFKNLDTSGDFTWYYPSNPKNESSHLVERVANSQNFGDLVLDIIQNNRFSDDYKNTTK